MVQRGRAALLSKLPPFLKAVDFAQHNVMEDSAVLAPEPMQQSIVYMSKRWRSLIRDDVGGGGFNAPIHFLCEGEGWPIENFILGQLTNTTPY